MIQINKLSENNFLSIYDVAMDIQEKLEMINNSIITIPLLRNIVRFPVLMPSDDVNMRDNYCQYRWDAIQYLKNNNYIKNYELIKGDHRWLSQICITVEYGIFDKFYKELSKIYEKDNTEGLNKNLIEWIKEDGILKIKNCKSISFKKSPLRIAVIDFFYNNADDRKEWQTYDDILIKTKDTIKQKDKKEAMRKAIAEINERIFKSTAGNYKKIIESDSDDNKESKEEKKYRWAF